MVPHDKLLRRTVMWRRSDGTSAPGHHAFPLRWSAQRAAALFRRPTKVFQDGVAAGGEGLRLLSLTGDLFVPYQLSMHFGVVLREETYLLELLGDDHRAYCAEVRRWH